MSNVTSQYNPEEKRFKSISDFKWCVDAGAEIEIVYHEKFYGIFSRLRRTPDSPIQILITETYIDNSEETEMWCDTADEVLEYRLDGVRLRDIITEVELSCRTV